MPVLDPELRKRAIALGLNPDLVSWVPEQTAAAPAASDESTALGAGARAFGRGLIPSLAAAGAGTGGWALGTALAPETGGLSLAIPIVTSLIGGGLGAGVAGKAQDVALEKLAPKLKATLEADAAQHPVATTVGGVASALPSFEFAPGASIRGISAAARLARGGLSEAERAAAISSARETGANIGLGAASGVVNPLLEGHAPTLSDIGMGAGQALLFGKPRFMREPLTPTLGRQQYDQPIGPEEPNPPFASRWPGLTPGASPTAAAEQNALISRALQPDYGPDYGKPPAQRKPLVPSIGTTEGVEVNPTAPRVTGEGGTETAPIGPSRLVGTTTEQRVGEQPPPFFNPQIEHLKRQLAEVKALMDNPNLPLSTRVDAQLEIRNIEQKLAEAEGQARSAPIEIPQRSSASAATAQLINQTKGPATTAEVLGTTTKGANAPHTEPQQVSNQPEHPGIQQGKNLPANKEEVRSQTSAEAGSGGGVRTGSEVKPLGTSSIEGSKPVPFVDVSGVNKTRAAQARTQAEITAAKAGEQSQGAQALKTAAEISGAQKPSQAKPYQEPPLEHLDKRQLEAAMRRGQIPPEDRYQEAVANAEQLPPDQLLTHPANADILAATQRIAQRHNVQLKATEEPITTPEGHLAAGVADIQGRLAKFNGNLATVDTGLHEVGHILLDDLRTSPIPAERALYDQGVLAMNGNEERLTQAIGIRSVDLLKNRIEGNTLARFREWVKDFWAWAKNKWGKANAQDLVNLMARRMVDGEAVARGERAPLSAQDNVRYQTAEQAAAEQRLQLRAGLAAKDIRERDFTVPLVRPVFDRVERIPNGGKHLSDAMRGMRQMRDELVGTYEAQANLELNKAPSKEIPKIAQRLFDENEGKTSKVILSPDAEAAYQKVKDIYRKMGEAANAEGIKINGQREIQLKNTYINHSLSPEARFILTQKQGSSTWNKLKADAIDYWAKGGVKQEPMSQPAAEKMWDDYTKSINDHARNVLQDAPVTEPHFAALERAEGFGLPESMRQMDLRQAVHSYVQRFATKMAWHHFVEGNYPGNDVTRSLLNRPDENGSVAGNATHLPDGTKIETLAGQKDIQAALKDIFRNYDRSDRLGDSLNRAVKSLFLQTFTGLYHGTSALFIPLQHIGVLEHAQLLPKAISQLSKGIAAGYRQGVLQAHANRIESTITEGATEDRIGKAADFLNEAADGITKITGRDALIKFARGLSMAEGMLKSESVIGRIAAKIHDKSDVRWMDEFAGEGKWEPILESGKGASHLIEQMAAKFTESVQGGYSAEHLPPWMLSGRLAPWFSLAKFSVDRFNNFQKVVVNPMINRGDFGPFLRLSVGALIGGTVLNEIKDLITERKPEYATWKEIAAASGDGLSYRLLATLVHTGYAGIFTDLVKQGFDVAQGRRAQGFSFPLISGIQTFLNRGTQMSQALESGENIFTVLPIFATTIAKDTTQMYRALAHFVSEDEARAVDRANAFRDLRMFQQQAGIQTPPQDSSLSNPFQNPLKRQFQRTENFGEAAAMAPQLFRQAIERSHGDVEQLKKLLNNYRSQQLPLMPSLHSTPVQFARYLSWLAQTQGPEAAAARMSEEMRGQAMDKAKASLIPRL